jgi:adenylate cyclase
MHVWADRYDRELKELLSVQDEVVHTVAATLAGRVEIAALGRLRRKNTKDLNAYDCYLKGVEHWERFTDEDIERARELFEQALALDSDFSPPYSILALIYNEEWYTTGSRSSLDKALELARKAVALDANESRGHTALGTVCLTNRQFDRAEAHMRQAASLNINDGHAAAQLSHLYAYLGRSEEALEWAERAVRLNPFHPNWYSVHRAQAFYVARRYLEAVDAVKRTTTKYYWDHMIAAACCAMAGIEEEARFHVAEVLVQRPGFSSRSIVSNEPYKNEADRDHLLKGLLKAGLPP